MSDETRQISGLRPDVPTLKEIILDTEAKSIARSLTQRDARIRELEAENKRMNDLLKRIHRHWTDGVSVELGASPWRQAMEAMVNEGR